MNLWNGDTASAALGRPVESLGKGVILAAILILIVAVAAPGQTRSFAFARYASASSSSLIVARGLGTLGGFVAIGTNPATGYHERVLGAFTQASWKGQRLFAGIAYADASESEYLQGYLTPTFTRGRLLFSATFKSYEPLARAGVRQLYVNPASLELRVTRRLWTGLAYVGGLRDGAVPSHSVGPVVEWTVTGAVLRVEMLDRARARITEIRAVVVTTF